MTTLTDQEWALLAKRRARHRRVKAAAANPGVQVVGLFVALLALFAVIGIVGRAVFP